ncbi:MAG: hypothetical protein H6502_00415 [Candidatus Woesearchaeota archaeon]|nr:MAG: hypothetical protein H6502_00415 [Candidatus Woesearchaeota archaeon]
MKFKDFSNSEFVALVLDQDFTEASIDVITQGYMSGRVYFPGLDFDVELDQFQYARFLESAALEETSSLEPDMSYVLFHKNVIVGDVVSDSRFGGSDREVRDMTLELTLLARFGKLTEVFEMAQRDGNIVLPPWISKDLMRSVDGLILSKQADNLLAMRAEGINTYDKDARVERFRDYLDTCRQITSQRFFQEFGCYIIANRTKK